MCPFNENMEHVHVCNNRSKKQSLSNCPEISEIENTVISDWLIHLA